MEWTALMNIPSRLPEFISSIPFHMKPLYLLPFLLFLWFHSPGQSFYFEDGDTLTVACKSGANLRDSNSVESPKLASIPFGEKVIARSMECCLYFITDTIDHRYGSWIKVAYQGKEGYMFTGFLTRLRLPKIDFESIRCFDTGLFEHIARTNADSLLCSGSRRYNGFDPDGKDSRVSKWEIYSDETKINEILGYENRTLIIESTVMDMNDVLNLCEYFLDQLKDKCGHHFFWQQENEYKHGIYFKKDGNYIKELSCGGLGLKADKLDDYRIRITLHRDE